MFLDMKYLTKIKIISIVLTVCLLITTISTLTRSGLLYISKDDVDSYNNIVRTIDKDKLNFSVYMGNIVDTYDETILKNDGIINENILNYDISYSYLLGNPQFDTTGILATQFDTLTDCSHSKSNKGIGIKLTIDNELQQFAYSLTEGSRKTIVIMDRFSGKIRALTSAYHEKFDLSNVTNADLEHYNKSADPIWLPEYLNTYQPGSVQKIFTAAVAFEEGLDDFFYHDYGYAEFNHKKIYNDYTCYGQLETIRSAFVNSSNAYFSTLGTLIGAKKIKEYSDKFLLNETIETDFGTLRNKTGLKSTPSDFNIAEYSYGQGESRFSAVSLAMMAQGATTGTIYQPHIIESTFYYDEDSENEIMVLDTTQEKVLSDNVVSKNTCDSVLEIMKAAAASKNLDSSAVGTKTGTAEISEGNRATIIGVTDNYIIVISEVSDGILYGSSHTNTMSDIVNHLN